MASESYKLIDWEPAITGSKLLQPATTRTLIASDQLNSLTERILNDNIAKQLLQMCEKDADFYDMYVDAKNYVPKELRKEVFYAAKLGEYSESVPAMCIYVVKEAWKLAHSIPNLLIKVIPATYLKQFLSEGYMSNGYTFKDVVCTFCDREYEPLSEFRRKIRHDRYSEVYIPDTDMVAAIPNNIADEITDDMISHIEATADGLSYRGTLLRTMGGHYGITNSVYDLRELI